jgi:ankyrin repeat protein
MSSNAPDGSEPLHSRFEATPAGISEAARAGDVKAIERILVQKPELLVTDNPHNWTKIADGHDISGSYNKKPVEVAAFFNQPNAVTALLKIGADSNFVEHQPTGAFFNSLRIAHVMSHANVVQAVRDNILARVDEDPGLLKAAAELGGGSNNKDTLLFYAARSGDMGLVKQLLQRGADPTVRSRIGHTVIQTVLNGSAEPERRETARLLIEKGAPVTIWEAVAMEDVDHVKAILSQNPDIAKQQHRWSISYPLVRACFLGNRELAELLIGHGADANATNVGVENPPEFGMPLYYAASRGHYDIANLLLDRKASPHAHGNAVPPLVDLMRERIAQYDPQGFGTGSPTPKTGNSVETTKLYGRLRSLGAEPFLHTLVRVRDHVEIERLLRNEADRVRHVYGRGQKKPTYDVLAQASAWLGDLKTTQLCLALQPQMHCAELANEMIDSAIRSHNRDGSFAEYRGIIKSNLSWLKENTKPIKHALLWSLAANYLENYRYSPNPDLPQMSELIKLAELFLEYGTDIDQRDAESNHTALSQAVVEGHTEYVAFLLQQGASAMHNDPPETHPRQLAEARGLTEIVELLSR